MTIHSSPDLLKKIWILGGGKFGQLALKRIRHHLPRVKITLVDSRPDIAVEEGVTVVHEDGISWLAENLQREGTADMVIPSLPVHMVAEWLKVKGGKRWRISAVPLPDDLVAILPHPLRNGDSRLYISHADFLCPDNCGEPELICTYTGREREENLFDLVGRLDFPPFTPLVIRSYQLLPGVGGIYPEDMWDLLDNLPGLSGRFLLITTACRCHGVVDGLRFEMKGEEDTNC
ncbi:MAG: potassium transporter [Deltaproteobacteria bacterium]|nr:potassium transporter [Deltaproteobacteria bacterium]